MRGSFSHISRRKRKHVSAAFVLSALCLAVAFPPAHASSAPNEAQISAFESAPEAERVKLLIHLAKSGQHDQAEWLLGQYPLTGPHAENRNLYLQGLILKARRDYTGAAEKFRAALANDPKLTLVRADLAQTLVILEQDDSAVYHLKQLAAEAPTDVEAKGVRSFMEQIDERSPFKRNFWIAAAPTSNVNYGARNPLLMDFGTGQLTAPKPTKAVGVEGGASLGFTKRLGNDYSVVAGLGLQGTIYENQAYSSLSLGESVEVRRLFEKGYLGLGVIASQSFDVEGQALGSYGFGPRATARFSPTNRTSISVSGQYEWREYDDTISAGSDGATWTVSGDITHYISPGFSLSLLAGYSDVEAELDFKAFETITGGVAVHKELPWGITTDISANYSQSKFDGLMPIYGFLFGLREDWRATGKLELTKRDLNVLGFAPALSYTYTFNESTVPLYDFDNHAIDLRFTKDF